MTKLASLLSLVTFTLLACIGMSINLYTKPGPLAQPTSIIIAKGSSLRAIAELLHNNTVITNPMLFTAITRLAGYDQSIKAGEYEFPTSVSLKDVLAMMRDGKTIMRQLTIPEGLATSQILELIHSAPGLSGEVNADFGEGELLPETYYYSYGDSRISVVNRMRENMSKTIAQLWQTKDSSLPFQSVKELITLASIVEKETGVPSERARVAGVFVNRLKKGIPLQSDPTVVFAVTNGKQPMDRPIYKRDLRLASPYNTYVYNGLPPGPIANPGLASIEATLNPEKHDYLFFVANGTGGHTFAKTLAEHNKNVTEWRKIERLATTEQAAK